VLRSKLGNACVVRYGQRTVELKTQAGGTSKLDGELK
jgi:hypothetical protein